MKIKKFKNINESLKNDELEWIDIFDSSIDENILEWVTSLSKNTRIEKEYKTLDKLNIRELDKYINLQHKKDKIESELNKINNDIEKQYFNASNELLYNFQKDLMEKDFQFFYYYFIKDNIELNKEGYAEIFDDVHPRIIDEEPNIKEKLDIYLKSSEFNL